ncbi:MAG: hypothetical protein QM305_06760 [Bacteroidota bacterium]|nr:hypothetical protein [Bacteroidota bacterium]
MRQLQQSAILASVVLFLALGCTPSSKEEKTARFEKALPVWAEGREKEMNLNLGFRASFTAEQGQEALIKVAAATLYRMYLNGHFIGSGPARAAHGYYRIDEFPVSDIIREGENILAIEVAGYNVNSYYTLDQPSFLLAEMSLDGQVVRATGSEGDFEAFQIKERLQKVERYSFQRPFTEYYRLSEGYDRWRTASDVPVETVQLATYPPVSLLPRHVAIPTFDVQEPVALHSKGNITKVTPESYHKDRSLASISDKLKGYTEAELEVYPVSQEIQEIVTSSQEAVNEPYASSSVASLKKEEFNLYDFGTNLSGFIGARVQCTEPARIMFYFDELLTDGDVRTKQRQSDICNHIVYELQPGVYDIETLESYTFRYLKLMVLEGTADVEKLYLREFSYPNNENAWFTSSNDKLNKVFEAAKQTFRQNAVDIFMDCPSRERAGWLCDSYFSSISERAFTGKTAVCDNFLENYALPERFEFLPEGMIPMCYPADHNDGVFIPNWSLWFIVQLDNYARNGGDPQLVAQLKTRVTNLLAYFANLENEDGLLEKLESWVFVEWSKANELVQDVNYPSNMLYSAALGCAGRLYGNKEWLKKSDNVKEAVLHQSYNGEFFVDNAIREESGELTITNNTTEACQYYAFFFNMATPESHPELWNKIVNDFGPNRDDQVTHPTVFRANAFIGNYLRMDILSRYNLQGQLVSEIQDYFYSMAHLTGTLWENMHSHASCNHGFASFIGQVLYRDVLGIKEVDRVKKRITIRFTDLDLEHCSGSMPVGDEVIKLAWSRENNTLQYKLEAPKDFKVEIENMSSAEIMPME